LDIRDIETPQGPARTHTEAVDHARALLVLGHGAGGSVDAPDLAAASAAAVAHHCSVVLVEQPYRVAGKRSSPRPEKLDEAWMAVLGELRDGDLGELTLIVGGRSAGARVACRTAAQSGATAVLCLAFPEHPPGKPEKTRQPELDAVELPTLVVQGESDPFGRPKPGPRRELVLVPGNHSLKADLDAVAGAVDGWLSRVLA
jgi:predicted alpha/beta-hydrolase family hydrolase